MRNFYESYAKQHDNRITMHNNPVPIRRYLNYLLDFWVVSQLKSHINSQTLLLDIGCGGGFLASIISDQVRSYIGCDISIVEALRAQEAGASVAVGDGQQLPFKEGTVDVVLLTAVIEHMPKPFETLKECSRVLQTGGTLVLATPNKYSPMEVLSQLLHRNQTIEKMANWLLPLSVNDPGHVSLLSAFQLKKLLKDAGFEVNCFDRVGLHIPGLELIPWEGYLSVWKHFEKIFRPILGRFYWLLMVTANKMPTKSGEICSTSK